MLAALAVTSVLALAGSTAGTPVDVRATHDRFPGHVEPDVAVDPTRPANLLGACQFETAGRTRLPGTFASFDGGRSWRDNGLLPLPAGYENGADTTVGFDRRGNGFVVALMWHGGGGYASRVLRGGIFLWRTTDGGRHFSRPIPVYVGRGFQDHPWLAIRPTPRPRFFVAWTDAAGLQLAVSRDEGRTFSRPRLLLSGSLPSNPVVTVGPKNRVSVFFEELLQPKIRLLAVESDDGGRHFRRVEPVGTVLSPSLGAGPKGGAQPPPLLAATTDPSSAASGVAIAGRDPRTGHPTIELWQRTNGRRWRGPSTPVAVTDAGRTQAQPRLVYAGGRLYFSYFTITRQGEISARLARPGRGGFVSAPLEPTGFPSSGFLGDYQALAVHRDALYAVWNDRRSGRLQIVGVRVPLRR